MAVSRLLISFAGNYQNKIDMADKRTNRLHFIIIDEYISKCVKVENEFY